MRYRMSEGMTNIGTPLKEAMERTPRPEVDAEQRFIDAWNDGKVRRVFDGAKPWAGLTDKQIESLADSLETWNEDLERWVLDSHTFARAIEAKLKEKNT